MPALVRLPSIRTRFMWKCAPAMSDKDLELFHKEMADVKPLEAPAGSGRVVPEREITPGHLYRRESAQRSDALDATQLPTSFVEPVRPEAIISFKRDGIQNGVFRKLQRGEYSIEALLDLHGYTVEEARLELFRFVSECQRQNIRMLLISHGKGHRNKDQIPLIKSYLVRWLPLLSQVMAFHSAQKWHGGAGAVYVLLRKSEKAKADTMERLGLRSVKPDLS